MIHSSPIHPIDIDELVTVFLTGETIGTIQLANGTVKSVNGRLNPSEMVEIIKITQMTLYRYQHKELSRLGKSIVRRITIVKRKRNTKLKRVMLWFKNEFRLTLEEETLLKNLSAQISLNLSCDAPEARSPIFVVPADSGGHSSTPSSPSTSWFIPSPSSSHRTIECLSPQPDFQAVKALFQFVEEPSILHSPFGESSDMPPSPVRSDRNGSTTSSSGPRQSSAKRGSRLPSPLSIRDSILSLSLSTTDSLSPSFSSTLSPFEAMTVENRPFNQPLQPSEADHDFEQPSNLFELPEEPAALNAPLEEGSHTFPPFEGLRGNSSIPSPTGPSLLSTTRRSSAVLSHLSRLPQCESMTIDTSPSPSSTCSKTQSPAH